MTKKERIADLERRVAELEPGTPRNDLGGEA